MFDRVELTNERCRAILRRCPRVREQAMAFAEDAGVSVEAGVRWVVLNLMSPFSFL